MNKITYWILWVLIPLIIANILFILSHLSTYRDFVKDLSPVIIGAICGAAFSLLGTWLQSRTTLNIFRDNQQYDRQQKETDRAFALRRELYLNAASKLAELSNWIMDFVSPTNKMTDIGPLIRAPFLDLAKTEIVAEPKTIEALNSAHKYFSDVFVELMPARMTLENLVIDRNIAKQNCDFYQKLIDEVLTDMKKASPNDFPNFEGYKNFLNKKFDDLMRQKDEALKKLNGAELSLQKASISLFKIAMDKLLTYNIILGKFKTEVRKELNIDTPEGFFEKEYGVFSTDFRTNYSSLLDKMGKDLEKGLST
jgi:hypothetical protein